MNKTENKLEREGARERKRTRGREGAGARARERQRRISLLFSTTGQFKQH